jgi:HK97 family phage major capsid protein
MGILMELKEFEDKLMAHKTAIEARVQEIAKATGDTAKAEVEKLRTELSDVTKTITNVQEQMRLASQREVPGLKGSPEAKKFDFGMAVRGVYLSEMRSKGSFTGDPWKGAEPEKEIIDSATKARGAEPVTRTTAIGGEGTLGGYLIPEEISNEVIDLAIADMPIMALGPTVIRGLVGDLPMAKLTARPTAYWVGETSKPTASNATFGQFTLRPKKLGAFTVQSNRLIYQSRGVSDQIIRQELANAIALKLEDGLINGLGSEQQPKGILNHTIAAAKALAGTRAKVDTMSAMVQYLDVRNEYKNGAGNFGWLMRPEVLGGVKRERVVQYSGQAQADGAPLLAMNLLMTNKLLEDQLGHAIRTTTLLSGTESAGSSTTSSTIIFGNWRYFRVGFWRDLILKASDIASDGSSGSAFLDDSLYIVAFQEVDCAVARETAFCKATGAECTEANW